MFLGVSEKKKVAHATGTLRVWRRAVVHALFPALALEPALAGRMTKTYHGETMSTKEYRRRLWLYNAHVRRMSDSERRAFVDELTGMKTEYAREADELFRYARTYAKSVMAARKHLHDDCRCRPFLTAGTLSF